jgi:type IV pilus assembly protein PilW
MNKQILRRLNKHGFTLVELLVAIAVAGIIMTGIYSTYYSQQKSYIAQEEIVSMQQNLRVAMFYMQREIRMAGCDPTQNAKPGPGIQTAGPNTISFTLDITNTAGTGNPDGLLNGPNENVTYSIGDGDADGDNDLLRIGTLLAENIDALDFVYLDGASPPNPLDDDGMGNVTTNKSQIRSVQVTLVARVGRADPGYTNANAYYNQQDLVNPILPAQNDNFRRMRLSTTIKCRNL